MRITVAEINVKIGDSVRKGDVLAYLSNATQAEAQLTAANLELANAQQTFDAPIRKGPVNLASAWGAYMHTQTARATAERNCENLNLDDIDDTIEEDKAESNLSKYVLTAPFDGVVAEVAAKVGEQVETKS